MQRRTKLLFWLLSFVFLFLVIIPLSLYLLSPLIAQKSLEHWLSAQKFSAVQLDMRPPGWEELRINSLHIEKNSDEQRLTISSENILIRFNPIDLYLHQKISLIQLPQSTVKIQYLTEDNSSESSNESIDLSNVLPAQWFHKVPAELIQIGELNLELDYPGAISDWRFVGALLFDGQELYSRVKFLRNTKDLGWGDLRLGLDNRLSLRLLEGNEPFVTIDGSLAYKNQLELTSAQQFDIARLQRWQQALFPRPRNRDEANNPILPALNGIIKSNGITAFPLKTKFTPDDLLKSIRTQQQFETNIKMTAPVKALDQLALKLNGALDFSLSELQLSIANQSSASISNLNHSALVSSIAKVDTLLLDDVAIKVGLSELLAGQSPQIEISPLSLKLQSSPIKLPNITLPSPVIALELSKIDLANTAFTGKALTTALAIQADNKTLPPLTITSLFTLNTNALITESSLQSSDQRIGLSSKSKTLLNSLKTTFNWKLKPIKLTVLEQQLSDYFPFPPELSLLSGTLFHNGSGQIQNSKFSLQANNSIRQGALNWDNSWVEGIQFDSRTTLNSKGRLIDKGTIKLEKVTSGIEITKVHSRYTYQYNKGRNQLTLDSPKAQILEGDLSLQTLQLDPLKPSFSTEVKIDKLDLGAVLKLEQQQGLSGEGKLSGHFPLSYNNGELTISDGKLLSLAPGGKITFQPTATVAAYAAANVGLKMAIEALRNFHYELLDIQLNYAADGTALLKTRLKGNNPDWNQGHPVDFTINIEENIPKLIKTLQFADKLTKTIEKRYR